MKHLWLLTLLTMVAVAMAQQKPKLTARISMNSGLRNPQWEITSAVEFDKVRAFLKDLPEAPETKWPGLGWRGFLLTNEGVEGLPEQVRVLHGVVRWQDHKGVRFYKDVHGLEDWLEEQAIARGLLPKSEPSH